MTPIVHNNQNFDLEDQKNKNKILLRYFMLMNLKPMNCFEHSKFFKVTSQTLRLTNQDHMRILGQKKVPLVHIKSFFSWMWWLFLKLLV